MADANDVFVGFVELDGTLAFLLPVRNTSDVPTAADAEPTYAIYTVNSDGTRTSRTTGTVGAALETGVYPFSDTVPSGEGFARGQMYSIQFTYAMSAANRRKVYYFMVV